MSSTIINKPLNEFIEENYLTYGKFVNLHRVIPGSDGLKPVYRRALLGAKNVADGRLAPTIQVLGAMQNYHPFGDIASKEVINNMVRLNMLDGDGAFGSKSFPEDLEAAAARYTQCGLTKEQSDYFFKLIDYAPEIEGEALMEPEYLIMPVPAQLIIGGFNWSFGIAGRTPAFTYNSLVDAYFNDDPTLLESNYGYTLDKNKSDLKQLWEEGHGKLFIHSKCERVNEDKITLTTSGEIFKPALGQYKKWIEAGQVGIGNESGKNIVLSIYRIPRARSVDMDEMYTIARAASVMSRYYNILVVLDDCVRTIGIREWMELTMSRYISSYEDYKTKRLGDIQHKINVLNLLPVVAKKILDQMSDVEIMKSTEGLTDDILASIKKRSIGSLRKTDWQEEISGLMISVENIKKEDPIEIVKNYGKSLYKSV